MGGQSLQERFAIQFVDGCFNLTGSGEDMGQYSSLAINPSTSSTPYSVNLSYYDNSNGDLRYAYKADSSNIWYTMSIDGSGVNNNVGEYTSIEIDKDGNRHIAYYDISNGNLKYAYGPSGGTGLDISWQIYIVDSSGDVGLYTSIRVDNLGNKHISYRSRKNETLDLKYAYGYSNNIGLDMSWNIYNVDSSGDQGRYTSLALDNEGNRHISYFDNTNKDLKYAYGPSGLGVDISWELYSVDTSGSVGAFSSLVLDNSGNPHISYRASTNSDLKYAFGQKGTEGISWEISSIDTLDNVGRNTSIAINPTTNKPSITYLKTNVIGNNEIRIASQRLNSKTSWEIGVLDSNLNIIGDNFNGNSRYEIDNLEQKHLSFYDSLNNNGRLRYAISPPGQYGDSCPTFATTISNVAIDGSFVRPVIHKEGFLDISRSPILQQPFNTDSRLVPDCN